MTDYSIVILSEMREDYFLSALEISQTSHVPLPTTNKILRLLTQAGICTTKAGRNGGFGLLRPLCQINILQVLQAIEKKAPFTQCSSEIPCKIQRFCRISSKMRLIDQEINALLASKNIADLLKLF